MLTKTRIAVLVSTALVAAAPVSNAATVLTLEGGLVGLQHIIHFTPMQLRGEPCNAPNHCEPVDYFAFPGDIEWLTEQGATKVEEAISELPGDEQIVLFGHSKGGQVIYSDLRRFAADPANAPDPARLTWISIGNPQNKYGGSRATPDTAWLPDDTLYQGIEVIRQYDGWADSPDDPSNFLARINATMGKRTIHLNYRNVDLDDPNNVRYTPDLPDGSPGNVTYVWVPTDILPLVAWAGPLAPMLDNLLRPMVEAGYDRPVEIPDPTPPQTAPSAASAVQPNQAASADTPPQSVAMSTRSSLRSALESKTEEPRRKIRKSATATGDYVPTSASASHAKHQPSAGLRQSRITPNSPE